MTDSGRILQASKVFGRFDEIKDGNLMLSNRLRRRASEAVSPHFDMTIDFVDEWLGRNVEALVINNVCVRLSDKENGMAHPEVATLPTVEAHRGEADDTPIVDAHEHDDDCEHSEVSAEATVTEVVEPVDEEEAGEAPEVPSYEVHAQAPAVESVEDTAAKEQAELPSFAAQVETADTYDALSGLHFEDEEEEEAPPAETPSHSYALSQSSSEPKTDDYRNRETEHFRF